MTRRTIETRCRRCAGTFDRPEHRRDIICNPCRYEMSSAHPLAKHFDKTTDLVKLSNRLDDMIADETRMPWDRRYPKA